MAANRVTTAAPRDASRRSGDEAEPRPAAPERGFAASAPAALRIRPAIALILIALAATAARAANHRFWLASQHDWGAKRGFYLNFENTSDGLTPTRLETLTLILGVADGASWRFLSVGPPWQTNRRYVVRAVISAKSAELWLDGRLVGRSSGGFQPCDGPLEANTVPSWASGPAAYVILEDDLELSSGGRRASLTFAAEHARPLALLLPEPQVPRRIEWRTTVTPVSGTVPIARSVPSNRRPRRGLSPSAPTEPTTIEAGFRIVTYDLTQLAPFIDRYGQCRYAHWPDKVKSDRDLLAAQAREEQRLREWGVPGDYDRYRGYRRAGWQARATGFFYVTKRKGFWWLVSPQGNPCFYLGLCAMPALTWEQTPVPPERVFLFEWLPPKEGIYAASWGENPWGPDPGVKYVALHTPNLIRKFGTRWQQESNRLAARRLRAWAFSGGGKWGGLSEFPETPVLGRPGPNLVRRPDFLDQQVAAQLREGLRKQIQPRRSDPRVVGWTVGSEYDEIVTADEVRQILAKGARPQAAPASKRGLVDYAVDEVYRGDIVRLAHAWQAAAANRQELYAAPLLPTREDLEQLRRWYADRYYDFVYRTVKELDPNHLYLGNYVVPGWWENDEDWRLIARHCDVMSYDRYAAEFADPWFDRLIREADKPVFCGEFAFPAWYEGQRGFGRYPVWARDDADSGEKYLRWVQAGARNPYCVGMNWFLYRDQPLTGRGPGHGPGLVYGEHYAFGMVDVTDRPKWDLVERVRRANLAAAGWRLEAAER